MDLGELRRDYQMKGLSRADLKEDPFEQFGVWFDEVSNAGILEPNARSLATSGEDGQVGIRTVLLKGVSAGGFLFFTNYGSRKAFHMDHNSQVGLLFPWIGLERQVSVTGVARKISREETQEYFRSRPLDSRLGAWASEQSAVIESRSVLEARFKEMQERFEGQDIPTPEAWGGYRVFPKSVEFWQGRPNRLHDRKHSVTPPPIKRSTQAGCRRPCRDR